MKEESQELNESERSIELTDMKESIMDTSMQNGLNTDTSMTSDLPTLRKIASDPAQNENYRAVNRIKSRQEFVEVIQRDRVEFFHEDKYCVLVSNLPKDTYEKELADFFNNLST